MHGMDLTCMFIQTLVCAPTLSMHQWRIQDFPLGGGGANLRRIHFSMKMYAKTKEIDPVGGARAGGAPWIRQ